MDQCDRVIAIGGSVGAIGAVKQLCATLPDDPHVGAWGAHQIAGIFEDSCPVPVSTAEDGLRLECAKAYVAAADHHLIASDGTATARARTWRGPRSTRCFARSA